MGVYLVSRRSVLGSKTRVRGAGGRLRDGTAGGSTVADTASPSVRRPAGAAGEPEPRVPLPRRQGHRLPRRHPVRRDDPARSGRDAQSRLRRGRLRDRGGGRPPHRRRGDADRQRLVHPPAALVEHCLENTGPNEMRVLGVFYPQGDPLHGRPKPDNEHGRTGTTNRREGMKLRVTLAAVPILDSSSWPRRLPGPTGVPTKASASAAAIDAERLAPSGLPHRSQVRLRRSASSSCAGRSSTSSGGTREGELEAEDRDRPG